MASGTTTKTILDSLGKWLEAGPAVTVKKKPDHFLGVFFKYESLLCALSFISSLRLALLQGGSKFSQPFSYVKHLAFKTIATIKVQSSQMKRCDWSVGGLCLTSVVSCCGFSN